MKQESHTRNEQMMLQTVQHPFIINLWGTFQDTANLYMVMDFVPGGELFTLLRRSNVSTVSFISPNLRRGDVCWDAATYTETAGSEGPSPIGPVWLSSR